MWVDGILALYDTFLSFQYSVFSYNDRIF